jgi:hypothetical protein
MHKQRCLQLIRGGFAISFILCLVVILLIIGVGLLSFGLHGRRFAVHTTSGMAARSAADAGLASALLEMNKQLELKTWSDSSLPSVTDEPLPNCDSSFSYTVEKHTVDEDNTVYSIESTGQYGLKQKKINCTLELKGLFEYAIFTQGDITLRNGTTVSPYNADADDPPMQIGTNSTEANAISIKTGVTIDGDVVVGVDGNPTVVIDSKLEAVITGQARSMPVPNTIHPITVPQYLLDMPTSGSLTSSATISSSAKYDSIDLIFNSTDDLITIDGPVELYVVGDIRIGNGDEMQIVEAAVNPDASLTLYLGGNLIIDNGGALSKMPMETSKLAIYGLDTCTNIDFKNSNVFYGAIYAPNADINLYNGVQMYGAVVGNSFVQDTNADFHYDMSLREVDTSDIGAHFVLKHWSE